MCNEYNGWINRETWLAALWLDSDGLYDEGRDLRAGAIARASKAVSDGWVDDLARHARSCWVTDFTYYLEDTYSYNSDLWDIPYHIASGMLGDLLNTAFGRIDWRAIAEHVIDGLIIDDDNWLSPCDDDDDDDIDDGALS